MNWSSIRGRSGRRRQLCPINWVLERWGNLQFEFCKLLQFSSPLCCLLSFNWISCCSTCSNCLSVRNCVLCQLMSVDTFDSDRFLFLKVDRSPITRLSSLIVPHFASPITGYLTVRSYKCVRTSSLLGVDSDDLFLGSLLVWWSFSLLPPLLQIRFPWDCLSQGC